jgi:Zn-dependent peptidase ImmA (M78 family)
VKWLDIRVGGQRWAIYLVSERHKKLRDDNGDPCKGMAYFDECRIYIRRELSEQARDELLLHELLHAVFGVSGAAHAIGDDKEEDVVRDVTPVLHRLLVDLGFRFPKGTAS